MKIFTFLLLVLFSSVSSSAQNWHLVNPKPTGNSLYSVCFVSPTTGYAVGSFGTIIKTSDGGSTWESENSGSFNDLRYVYFYDSLTGYINDNSGIILKTNDGGQLWDTLSTGVSHIYSLCFINSDTGYAATAGGSNGSVIMTIDGGVTWTNLVNSGSGNWWVYFKDVDHGYAVTWQYFRKTTDGGVTWSTQAISGNKSLSSVWFTSDSIGFAACDNNLVSQILKTSDGGDTWQIAWSDSMPNAELHFYFVNPNHGYALGGKYLETTDGGNTWIPFNYGYYVYGISYPTDTTGFMVGYNGTVIKSINTGNSWTKLNYGNTNNLFSLFFPSENIGYAAGDSGTILKTIDTGHTWSTLITPVHVHLASICFLNDLLGFSVGDSGVILKTMNGGSSWDIINSGVNNNLTSIYFTDFFHGFVVGNGGLILKTMDGGTTWTTIESGVSENFSSVHFPISTTGYIVGSDSVILKTSDGGDSWNIHYSGNNYSSFSSVFFLNPDTGYAVSDWSAILKTTDGGNSWFNIAPQFDFHYAFFKVWFKDSDTGYVAGGFRDDLFFFLTSGFIFKTCDGGITWVNENCGIQSTVNSIFFTGNNTGYACSYNGNILKTVDLNNPSEVPYKFTDEELSLYPNPSPGNFTLVLPENCQAIFIYNTIGELVQKRMLRNEKKVKCDLQNNGIYTLQVVCEKSIFCKKIIICH